MSVQVPPLETLLESPRVILGTGCISTLPAELKALGRGRVLFVTTAGRRPCAEALASAMGESAVGIFAESAEHVPASVAASAIGAADAARADAVVAVGGGSAIGVAKAVAAKRPVRLIAIPTTYSGSEMTDLYGITEDGQKKTARAPNVRPSLVLYDPELTLALPPKVSAASGFNALAHAVEAQWVLPANAEARSAGARAIQELATALPRVVSRPDDLKARTQALRGAFFAGRALEGGVALHHKLCHLLGGRFGLPHAETHTVLLPHVTHYNADPARDAMHTLRDIVGGPTAALSLFDLAERIGAPTALGPLGFAESDVSIAVEAALGIDASKNPRPVERAAVETLFDRARRGQPPLTP